MTLDQSLALSGKELNLNLLPGAFSEAKNALGFDAASLGWALRYNAHFTAVVAHDIDTKLANLVVSRIIASSENIARISWCGGDGDKVRFSCLHSSIYPYLFLHFSS